MYLLYLGGALGGAIVSLYQNGGCNEDDIELKDTIEIDFTYDYTEDIKADVAYVASLWLYVIWDTELNNLWRRFSSLANQDTKEMVLEEQRNWIARAMIDFLLSTGIRVGDAYGKIRLKLEQTQ